MKTANTIKDNQGENQMYYRIETRSADSNNSCDWDFTVLGEQNIFDSAEEAWSAVEELKRLGEDWASAQYSVVEL